MDIQNDHGKIIFVNLMRMRLSSYDIAEYTVLFYFFHHSFSLKNFSFFIGWRNNLQVLYIKLPFIKKACVLKFHLLYTPSELVMESAAIAYMANDSCKKGFILAQGDKPGSSTDAVDDILRGTFIAPTGSFQFVLIAACNRPNPVRG